MAQVVSHEMYSRQEEASQPHSTTPKVPRATHEPTNASRTTSMTAHEPVTRKLHKSLWPLVTLAVYIALNLFAWIVFCIASMRLAGTKEDTSTYFKDPTDVVTKHENLLRAAQIVQAIATLLTIPFTSAICSMALVAFIQTGSLRTKLTLRQTMALADQGWISPRIWTRVSKVGSLPLYFAFGLTLVGAAFQIVQHSLVQTMSTQVPFPWTQSRNTRVPDISMLLNNVNKFYGTAPVRLRSILESANKDEYQPYLWFKKNAVNYAAQRERTLDLLNRAAYDQVESELWMAPLFSDFSSGVYAKPQYAPRVNTTVIYTNMTAGEWPSNCARDTESVFFAEYHQQLTTYSRMDLVVCMPTNISSSPWSATHNRQDITEELYLNISSDSAGSDIGFYKATAKTSLGYFELPSVHNGYNAGPLLDKATLPELDKWGRTLDRRQTNETYVGNVTQSIGPNIGPLTSLALALFGEGSFIDTRLANPSAYVVQRPETTRISEGSTVTHTEYSSNCVSSMPLAHLMGGSGKQCFTDYESLYERSILNQVNEFVSLFTSEYQAQKTLTAAAFLANKAWLAPDGTYLTRDMSRAIYVDPGVPTIKTSLSLPGIIVGSVLLGAHLLGLLALALYAFVKKPFAQWLGAEIMVKAGTAYAEELRAAEGDKQWKNAAAACKGFVGDERAGGEVGRMAFGASAGLDRKRGRRFEGL